MEYPKFSTTGEWWSTDNPETKSSGIFEFSREGGGSLETIGGLREPFFGLEWKKSENGTLVGDHTTETDRKSAHYDRIIGDTQGGWVTLEDCTRTSASGSMRSYRKEVISCTWALVGARFEKDQPLEFDQFSVHLGNLTRWAAKTGLRTLPVDDLKTLGREFGPERNDVWLELHARMLEKQSIELENGWTISIVQDLKKSGDDLHDSKLSQEFFFSAKHPDLRPLSEIFNLMSDLQDLVTISSTGASAIRRLTLRRPDVTHGPRNYRKNIEFYGRWNFPNPASPEVDDTKNKNYFNLHQIGGLTGVREWLQLVDSHRLKVAKALAGRYFSGMMIDDRILNSASALESLSRNLHKDKVKNLKTHLIRLQGIAAFPFSEMVSNPEKWANTVKDHRNESAHNFEKLVDSDFAKKYWLSVSTYWLFVICMMRLADFPEAAFAALSEDQDFIFHCRKLREHDLT